MRRLTLVPLLVLIGSCANQEALIQTSGSVPEPASALIEGAPLVELDYGRFQILYDCQLGEPEELKDIEPSRTWKLPSGCDLE
ncbi:hypothetical protein [Pseudomonas tohonis]|uniref:hypothetical protein n=1 Tax=Pseudomonas tohonis TaxID=2725477 RepID=UPI001F3DF0ED|nr:hypothetical protein [Pseudomonas tohonis]